MMKFTVNAKELKTMMEKVMTTINKKAALADLTRLYFQVDENDILKVWGTNLNHYIEVRTDMVYQTKPGVIGIDNDDVKIISKMTGEITLEDISTETEMKINIRCGKKNVTIPKYANIDIFLPSLDDTEEKMLTLKENWLFDTVSKLEMYTETSEANKMLNVFHFNTKEKRVEALDGKRIGMRKIQADMILSETNNPFDTIKLHKMCVPVFKKIVDKKSDAEVIVSQDKKYVKVKGNNFTYITRRIDGEYYKVDQMLKYSPDYSFIVDREQVLEVMTYNADLAKTQKDERNKKPVVLYTKEGKLYSYIETYRYEAFDELEVKENTMKNGFCIGFDPKYLTEAFSIVDSEEPVCNGTNPKAPLIIEGNEYSFLILPVNINGYDCEGKIERHIEKR